MSKSNIIFTDGSCHNGTGSWAFIHVSEDHVNAEVITERYGYSYNTTNNRMELQAIINAIESMPMNEHTKIFSDSGYCVTGYNGDSYLKKWIYNGWKTSKKQPVENKDLWLKMLELRKHYDFQLILIKGHVRDKTGTDPHAKWNNWCDAKCTDLRLMALNRYEGRNVQIPYECPQGCRFTGEMMDQGGMCYRCPVILCKDPEPCVPFEDYRNDWLCEWDKYFKGEITLPILAL